MAGCEHGDEQSGYKKKIWETSLVYEEESSYQQNLLSIELGWRHRNTNFLDSHMNYCAAALTHRNMRANKVPSHDQDIWHFGI